MDTLTARYSPWRLLLMMLVGALFVAASVWMALAAEVSPIRRVIGVLGGVFFAGVVVLAVPRLFDRSEQLRVSPDGIYFKQWSTETIPWREITDVTVWKYRRTRSIILHLADPQRFPSTTLLGRFRGGNKRMTGGDIPISPSVMDRRFNEVLSVIEAYRAAH